MDQAVKATKLGAFDYLQKADDATALARLRERVRQAVREIGTLIRTVTRDPRSRGMLATPVQGFYGIISQDSQMREIFELIQTIADSWANVLIHGETGTGKELVARAVHEASGRHGKPFVTLDCGALARELLESELFGHEKGAFTGAADRHVGRFERANTGTLFLDEVANINLNVQAKLLRVLQTRTFERVGGSKPISVDVRIIAATNRPLETIVTEGTFREDCIIDSMWSRSTCRHCATARRISRCWRWSFCDDLRVRTARICAGSRDNAIKVLSRYALARERARIGKRGIAGRGARQVVDHRRSRLAPTDYGGKAVLAQLRPR